jgi:C1A family cysteine protease
MALRVGDLKIELRRQRARWTAEQTPISLIPDQRRHLRLGFSPRPGGLSLADRENSAMLKFGAAMTATAPNIPASTDWRTGGFVTSIKDQGECGSCVAFGTCAAVESMARIGKQDPTLAIDLSEAQLFYCYGRQAGRLCEGPNGGWWPDGALGAFQSGGVADEACYPYVAGDQNCTNLCSDWQSRATKISASHTIPNPPDMKSWLAGSGPLITCFSVYEDFYPYGSGIYHHVTGGFVGGHCVCIVGYDEQAGCWICKNSWGPGWGEQGFFQIAYGQCGIDAEMWAVDGIA